MMMRPGELRHRIDLQSSTAVPDGMGGQVLTWETVVTVWAAIWPVSAAEQVKAGAPAMTVTHRIRIRYYEPLRGSWRIKKTGEERYFSIGGIVDKDERHFQQDILCKETPQ